MAAGREKVRFVDVGAPAEYTDELGHVASAELVPLDSVEGAAQRADAGAAASSRRTATLASWRGARDGTRRLSPSCAP